jgi:hypothetical protein
MLFFSGLALNLCSDVGQTHFLGAIRIISNGVAKFGFYNFGRYNEFDGLG